MYDHLPALSPLLAFEAAARLGSFKRAAGELHVTASAISQRIRALEEELAVPLFERVSRRVELTEAGRRYHDAVSASLGALSRASQALRERYQGGAVRLSMDPYLAHELVVPRMHHFHQLCPDVDLRIETGAALADFDRENIDAALRFGLPPWPGLAARLLLRTEMSVMCAPAIAARIRKPADLEAMTLITLQDRYEEVWGEFGKQLRISFDSSRVLFFDNYFAIMQAAESGLGIALGLRSVMGAWLADGRLVEPLNLGGPVPHALYFVCRQEEAGRPELRALSRWFEEMFEPQRTAFEARHPDLGRSASSRP